MPFNKYLKHQEYGVSQDVFVTIDPATKYGLIGQKDGSVERVEGKPHIMLVTHDWQIEGVDEDTMIAKVLCEAAEASPLKLSSPAAVTPALWTKFRPLRALLVHPTMLGKFLMPLIPDVITHEVVPPDRVIALKTEDLVGWYIKQGQRRNVVAHNKRGLNAIQFYSV